MDGSVAALLSAEEQAKRSTAELGHVTEDLRREQDRSGQFEKQRSSLEVQIKDLQLRAEEAEAALVRNGKKIAQKLEQRIAELESQGEADQRRYDEAQKAIKKLDRRVKEVLTQLEDEQKSKTGLVDSVEDLQGKVKTLKRQIEEAVSDGGGRVEFSETSLRVGM